MTAPVEVLVYSEDRSLQMELLGKARQVADQHGGSVSMLLLGTAAQENVSAYAMGGCDRLYVVEDGALEQYQVDVFTSALAGVVEQLRPVLVLVGGTKRGLEIAPSVAERVKAGYASWALDFGVDPSDGQVTATCMIYSGMGTATYRFAPTTTVLTAAAGVFGAGAFPGRTARAEVLRPSLPAPVATVLERRPKMRTTTRLEDAAYVIDVGQGVKQRDDLALVEALALRLGGQLACTRPLACDREWFPEWLGLSGAKIRPRLCLTLGVSGAIQHVIGIRESKVIASVNSDEHSGMFTQTDYGVVADLYEFIPVLIERMASRGIGPV